MSCLVLSCPAKRDRNASWEGSHAQVNMADDTRQINFYKSKSSSHFPNLDANNAWQMDHNSQQGFFLGQELFLDFAACIDLTSNADNLILYQLRW